MDFPQAQSAANCKVSFESRNLPEFKARSEDGGRRSLEDVAEISVEWDVAKKRVTFDRE